MFCVGRFMPRGAGHSFRSLAPGGGREPATRQGPASPAPQSLPLPVRQSSIFLLPPSQSILIQESSRVVPTVRSPAACPGQQRQQALPRGGDAKQNPAARARPQAQGAPRCLVASWNVVPWHTPGPSGFPAEPRPFCRTQEDASM